MATAFAPHLPEGSVPSEDQTKASRQSGVVRLGQPVVFAVDKNGAIFRVTSETDQQNVDSLTARPLWNIMEYRRRGADEDSPRYYSMVEAGDSGELANDMGASFEGISLSVRSPWTTFGEYRTIDRSYSEVVYILYGNTMKHEEVSTVSEPALQTWGSTPMVHKIGIGVGALGFICSLLIMGTTDNVDLAIGFLLGFTGLYVSALLGMFAIRRALDEH